MIAFWWELSKSDASNDLWRLFAYVFVITRFRFVVAESVERSRGSFIA